MLSSLAEMSKAPSRPLKELHPYDPRRTLGRFGIGLAAGILTAAIVPASWAWRARLVAGWDATALTLLLMVWGFVLRNSPAQTRSRAAADDPGRNVVWALCLLSSTFSLFAATGVLRTTHGLPGLNPAAVAALCLSAVVLSWLLTHTAYTLRYAHLYYRDDGQGEGGLEFPDDGVPNDVDSPTSPSRWG